MTCIIPLSTMRRRRDPAVAQQVLRRFTPATDSTLPAVPWQGLFLEPAYADGEPYNHDHDDEDDDTG